ncbi:sushi, von Willebrand factor type A, EGF and pentraxin domain-containing protein 1-like [Sycon ciliatum]|uniref:sushi, von Willebrand factor type A, EGF and pentraxin domain-containing protein 1-like n=1 Tax=Sycon ciliatum TaxID=27933 RepID=UPI0031F6C1C7
MSIATGFRHHSRGSFVLNGTNMATLSQSAGVLIRYLLLFSPLFLIGCEGQTVYLKAKNTGQTAPFTVTFGDGQLTRDVNKFLPTTSGYSFYVTFLRLEKTTGSFALYNRIIQSGFSVDPFNGDYPHLTTSYSGRYHWRVMNRNSTDTYQLNIVAEQNRTTVISPTMVFSYTDKQYEIPCNTLGSPGMSVTWTSTIGLTTKRINTTNGAFPTGLLEYVNSTFSFTGTDSGIMFSSAHPAGAMFNLTCTTTYPTSYKCRFVEGQKPQPPKGVLDRCDKAVAPLSTTYTISLRAPCPQLNASLGYVYNGTLSNDPGTVLGISCRVGLTMASSTSSIDTITCQGNGMWTNLPNCTVVICTVPTLMNGIADGTIVSYLQSVNYTCNTGYRMNGSATARCSADGTLQMPTCNIVNCVVPNVAHGHGDKRVLSYLQQVNYTCATGYSINGSEAATCGAIGNLTEPKPTCNIVNCTVPTLMNGIADGTIVSYLQSVNYTCNTGYRMNGSSTATCSADGTLQMPICNNLAIFLMI